MSNFSEGIREGRNACGRKVGRKTKPRTVNPFNLVKHMPVVGKKGKGNGRKKKSAKFPRGTHATRFSG